MQIPEGVNFSVDGATLKAKGPGGEVSKSIPNKVQVKVNGKEVEVVCEEKMLCNTWQAHVKNMLIGAKDGYKIKLKIIFAHFPITLEIKGKEIMIKNFVGEKVARKAKIVGVTKVEAKGQEVTVSGPDKDAVGQTIANMRSAMKTRNRDPRVFQDGVYVVS